jgi:hypothetical protein
MPRLAKLLLHSRYIITLYSAWGLEDGGSGPFLCKSDDGSSLEDSSEQQVTKEVSGY